MPQETLTARLIIKVDVKTPLDVCVEVRERVGVVAVVALKRHEIKLQQAQSKY